MANILIIGVDKGFCYTLTNIIQSSGHAVTSANFLRDGLDKALRRAFDVVFLDVMLSDGYGLDALQKIRRAPSKPEIIIITSNGDPDGAELAIKNGAWDYIQKPSSIKQITLPFFRALQYRKEKMVKPSERKVFLSARSNIFVNHFSKAIKEDGYAKPR